MKMLLLGILFILISCNSKTKTAVDKSPAYIPTAKDSTRHVQEKYAVGDINNDWISDTAVVDYQYNFEDDQVVGNGKRQLLKIKFSKSIPDLIIDQSRGLFANATYDMNNDNANEIMLFSRSNEGNWNNIFVYSFNKTKWMLIAKAKCFYSDNSDEKNRIIQEKNQYYLVGDSWDDRKGGVIKRNVRIKIKN